MEYRDYYAILEIPRDATLADIKRAYKKSGRKFHPDVSKDPDAQQKFIQAKEAYEVLKDPQKRAAYDQLGKDWHTGENFDVPPNWEGNFEFSSDGFTQGDTAAFSDFFESLFGGHFGHRAERAHQARSAHQHFSAKGEDIHAKVQIDIEDSFHGAVRSLTLPASPLDGTQPQTVNLKIPKGVREGQHIRLGGKGMPGHGGGATGDLYLEVSFRPHPLYRLEQKNLCLSLPVTPWEAALGAKIKIPTPTGAIEVTVPANSVSGKILRLRGRGLPGTSPGDMLITLNIVQPKVETEQEKALFRQMQDLMPFNPRSQFGFKS
ncbi:DnaJ C-terminal domain-containing protein [Photobacterium sp. TY1-4]|uniref:DnaJ C-terminal domain-containing protein n=1 Tax=Photobacterium sp. TY1-4 TaxID=2899122 RepID=UPI0021C21E72|nr:DnaJ C-terminal domain-containing protein [Photobacterium sp. TY1-4]UXI04537.1 DnaJ domain-containing protein [Photobacterium sp. TY1-4]